MKVVCIAKEPKQDKNTGKWYLNDGTEYDVSNKRGKELIATGYFKEAENTEVKVENKK